MANIYNPHLLHWLKYCFYSNINLVDPLLADLVSYLAMRAQYLPWTSVLTNISAIKKFFAANLVQSSLFTHPSITAFSQVLNDLPLRSQPHKKVRLTMSKPALELASHIIYSQPNLVDEDKATVWTLLLICFFARSRVGDQ